MYFHGATRFQFPQWLLAAMKFSGLWEDEFVHQVSVRIQPHTVVTLFLSLSWALMIRFSSTSLPPNTRQASSRLPSGLLVVGGWW